MRITVFTSNQPRHVALIEQLASVAERVHAVQECNTIFPGRVADFFRKSEVMRRYFERVIAAEKIVFGGPRFPNARGGAIETLAVRMGDLNSLDFETLAPALDADLFVVFGASFIRGPLCDLLVSKGAINIHMGVSPQYRGSSCNFWALYDGRPGLVGATIHRLSRGLDSGPMLFHALPAAQACDGFLLGMNAVKAAHDGLVDSIRTEALLELEPVAQDRSRELRYTRNADFTDAVAEEYLSRRPAAEEILHALSHRDPAGFLRPCIASARSFAPQKLMGSIGVPPWRTY